MALVLGLSACAAGGQGAGTASPSEAPDAVGTPVIKDALPELPKWVIPGKTWAPEVTEITPGNFVMYFTAANTYGDDNYAVGYATSTSLTGPWLKKEEPFLSTDSEDGLFRGPGGQDVVRSEAGEHWLVFHGWDKDYTYRSVYAEPLEWTESGPDLRPD